jgi:molybdopterin-guanine dinucleotide biosynthesis protein B
VDLVVVEGFKGQAHPKVEVHRTANGKPFLHPGLPNVRGLVTDAPDPAPGLPSVHLDDLEGAADLLLSLAEPLEAVAAALAAR